MRKKISLILVGCVVLLFVSATIIYALILSPKKRAEMHLTNIHQAIDEVHPEVLLSKNAEFQAWHKDGYAATLQRLPEVKTSRDLNALIRFYVSGYQDSHLWGDIGKTPFNAIESQDSRWAGWLLRATEKGYFVDITKQGDNYPPKDAELLSCDNKAIDVLLREHFAPYFDRRWHILHARQQSARALTLISDSFSVLNRPHIHQCNFRIADNEKSFRVDWRLMDAKDQQIIQTALKRPHKLPGMKVLPNGELWISASDFKLDTPEAYQAQQQLLSDLESYENPQVIIFDTRLNRGGNSNHGFQIISRILNSDERNYLSNEWDLKTKGQDAQFRASWKLYWNYDYWLREVLKSQGAESATAKFLAAAKDKIKQTLDGGQHYFNQSDLSISEPQEADSTPAKLAPWNSSKKIILITSNNCSSACLDFVDMVKFIPGLIHAGEPTNADTSYIEVAQLQSSYYGEIVNIAVPAKKWNKRLREDNIPYIPDIIYPGDIYQDTAVEKWVLELTQQDPDHSNGIQ